MKIFISILLFLLTFSSFGQLKIVKDNIACLYGLKNNEGEWVVPAKYTLIEHLERWNLYKVYLNNYNGILNEKGEEIFSPEYQNISIASYEYQLFLIQKNKKKGIINLKGKIIVPIEYTEIHPITDNLFSCVSTTFNYYLRDSVGAVNKLKYEFISFNKFSNKKIIFTRHEYKKNKFHEVIYDEKLDTITEITEESYEVKSSYIKVIKNGKISVYNQQLEMVLAPKYSEIKRQNDNLEFKKEEIIAVKDTVKWGLVNSNGKIVADFLYDEIAPNFSYYSFWQIKINSKYGIIDSTGKTTIPPKYDQLNLIKGTDYAFRNEDKSNYFIFAVKDGKTGIINSIDQEIMPFDFSFFQIDQNRYILYNDSAIYATYFDYSLTQPIIEKSENSQELGSYIIVKFKFGERVFKKNGGNKITQYLSDAVVRRGKEKICIQYNEISECFNLDGTPYQVFDPMSGMCVRKISDSLYIYLNDKYKYGIIDNNKNKLVIDNKYYILKSNGGYEYFWIKENYNNNCHYKNEDAVCGWKLCNKNGKPLIDISFDLISDTYETKPVFTNGKAGFYDFSNWQFKTNPIYKSIHRLYNNSYFYIATDTITGFYIYNLTGHLIFDQKWNKMQRITFLDKMEEFKNSITNPYRFFGYVLFNPTDTAIILDNGISITDMKTIHKTIQKGNLISTKEFDRNINSTYFSYSKNIDSTKVYEEIESIQHFFSENYSQYFYFEPRSGYHYVRFNPLTKKSIQVFKEEFWVGQNYSYEAVLLQFNLLSNNFASILKKTNETGIPFYHNLYKTGTIWKEFSYIDLFNPNVNLDDIMTILISDAIFIRDDLNLNCNNPKSYFSLTEKKFTFDENGIIVRIRDENNDYPRITIPWAKLQKYAPEKGIVADFIEAGKK